MLADAAIGIIIVLLPVLGPLAISAMCMRLEPRTTLEHQLEEAIQSFANAIDSTDFSRAEDAAARAFALSAVKTRLGRRSR